MNTYIVKKFLKIILTIVAKTFLSSLSLMQLTAAGMYLHSLIKIAFLVYLLGKEINLVIPKNMNIFF